VDAAGAPVPGVVVTVEGAAVGAAGAVTDAEGRFAIGDTPSGASLVAAKDGYAIALGTAGDGADIVLLAETQAAETITVTGEAPPSTLGATRLRREELQRLPGTGNDVMRALSAMPGVTSAQFPLSGSGLVIRGSSPQDSKLLIDDFEVPALYHDVGFRSIVPSEAIESLEYVPGGFDVAYGRAASGIVHLTTREGAETASEQAEISAGEASALAQGRLGERGRYMVALRRSAFDLLLPLLLPDDLDLSLSQVPRYYDEQLRIDYRISSRWSARLSSVGSDDALELYASRDRNPDKRFANRTRFARLTAAARYHDGPWTANLALSGIAQQQTFERGLYQHLEVDAPGLTARGEIMRTAAKTPSGLREVAWRLGAESTVTRYAIDAALPGDRREGEPTAPDDPNDTSTRFDGRVVTRNFAAWTALAGSLDERIRLTAGLRVDAYARVGDAAVQPRGELAVKLRPTLTAKLSAGAYSRPPEHQTELFDTSLRAERSTQLVAGTTYEPAAGVRVQVSGYYTDRRRLITRDAMTGALGNQGRGTTAGAELLATAKRGPWFGWLSYAYSHSTRIDAPGAERRLFDYDQPHNLNAAASYRGKRWQIGARFRLSSGLPQTPVDGALFDSDANMYVPAYGEPNSARAPLHHQLDLRIDRSFRWGPLKMTKFLDLQNVYANDTVVGFTYNFDYSERAAFRTLPFVPTAGLRGEF
jgi:hypothetical protein